MPGSPANTSRHSLPRYGGTDPADFPTAVNALADAIDSSAPRILTAGTLSARPAAGTAESYYFATDVSLLFRDTGSAWVPLGGTIADTFANRPAAGAVGAGATFFATDIVVEYVSTGSAWVRNGQPAGLVQPYSAASAPTGWIIADGSAVTTTYADLRTALLNAGSPYGTSGSDPKLPDLRGRTIVGSGTGASLTARAVGDSGGAETHTLTEAQLPAHTHAGTTVSNGAHDHTGTTASGGSHNHSGSSTGSAGAHDHSGSTSSNGDHNHGVADVIKVGGTGWSVSFGSNGSYGQFTSTNGAHTHSFTTNNTGSHTHSVSIQTDGAHTHSFTTGSSGAHTHTFTSDPTGSGNGHNNMQPFLTLAYIVKL